MRLFQENKIAADIAIMVVCIGSAVPFLFGIHLATTVYSTIMSVIALVSLFGIAAPFFTNLATIKVNIFISCSIAIFSLLSCFLSFLPGDYTYIQSLIDGITLLFVILFLLSLKSEFERMTKMPLHIVTSLLIWGLFLFLFFKNIQVNPANWIEDFVELLIYALIINISINHMLRKASTRSLYASVFLIFVSVTISAVTTNLVWFGKKYVSLLEISSFQNLNLFCSTLLLASLVLYSLHTLTLARKDVEQLRSMESSKSYIQLLKVIQDGYISIDPENLIINECSESAAKMLGFSGNQMIDLKKEDPFGLIGIIDEIASKNSIIEKKVTVGQRTIELKFSQSPIRNKSRILALVRDVTAIEKQMELEVRKIKILEVLVDIANAANRMEGIGETSSYTITTILELLSYDFGTIFVYDNKTDRIELLSPVGATGVKIMDSNLPGSIRNSLSYKSIVENREIVIDSSSKNHDAAEFPMIKMLGLKSVIIIPFYINPGKNGCLFIGSKESRCVTAEEMQLARTVAIQIGIALDRGYLMAALDEKYRQLEQSNRVKDDLITMIGHELRTPLTSIVGYVELLDTFNESLDDKQKDFVSVLHHQTDMLAWLVTQITMLTSLKTGRYRIDVEVIDICQVISSLSGRLSEISDIKQVKVISDVTHSQRIKTDLNAFLGICMNLVFAFQRLSNVETLITLHFTDTSDKLIIEASDNSSPLGTQDLEIIFEMFTSLPTKPSTTIKGTIGLPLSIVKELTLLLGGKIWFDSDVGGNKVVVELPLIHV